MIIRLCKKIYNSLYLKIFGMNKYLKKKGVKIGDNPHIYSDISTTESYLITIGNNVTISNGVQFITHDNSICKVLEGATDVFGEIKIGDNCFIGAKSIILYGVTLPNNTIVAAGSVVAKSPLEEGKIIGGNPAKIIGDTKSLKEKMEQFAVNLDGLSSKEKRSVIKKAKLIRK